MFQVDLPEPEPMYTYTTCCDCEKLQAELDKLRLEFDAYRDKVKRLAEAAKMVEPSVDVLNSRRVDSSNPMSMLIAWNNVFSTLDNLNKAITDLDGK